MLPCLGIKNTTALASQIRNVRLKKDKVLAKVSHMAKKWKHSDHDQMSTSLMLFPSEVTSASIDAHISEKSEV